MKKFLFPACVLLHAMALAQFTNSVNVNTIVRDDPTFEEATPIAAGANGKILVCYFEQSSSNPYNFSMQTLDENGNYVTGAGGVLVSNYPQGTALFRYDMKADVQGNLIAAFQDQRTGALDVVGYGMTYDGNPLWGAAGVTCHDPASAGGISPNVGALSNGEAIIAWVADGTPKDWVSIQRITPNGTAQFATPLRIIDSTNTVSYSRPQVVGLPGGDFVVVYVRQAGNFPPVSTVFAQRYTLSGQKVWTQPVQVSTKTIGFQEFPSVVSDGNNGVYVSFTSSNPASQTLSDVWVQRVDASGHIWSATGSEALTGTSTQRFSTKIWFRAGMPGPYVLMKETDVSQANSSVKIQGLDSTSGTPVFTGGLPITTLGSTIDEPYDIKSLCGNLVVLFGRSTTGNTTLYACKVDYNGATQWPNPFTLVSGATGTKLRGQLTIEHTAQGNSQVVAVWEDQRNGRGVYAQNVGCDGSTGPLFITGIQGKEKEEGVLTAYPNPSPEWVSWRVLQNDKITCQVIDAYGRVLMHTKGLSVQAGNNEWPVKELLQGLNVPAGVYTFRMIGSGQQAQVRVVLR